MASHPQDKRDFATRLSQQTLTYLDELVQRGRFRSRTAAIEAAVESLYQAEHDRQEGVREAFDRACGALPLGIDRERWRRAELDRLEWEARENSGPDS